MTTQTLTSIAIIAVLTVAVFVMAFRLFKTFYLLKEVKTRLNLETEQKEHYKKKLAASPTRQEFIEQSEMATAWRQKYDRLEENCEIIKQELYAAQNLNDVLHADNVNLESEIDRANEFITEAKGLLERQRLVIEEAHWDFDELAKFAESSDNTGTILEYLKVSRRNVFRTPAPIHLFPNFLSAESLKGEESHVDGNKSEEILMVSEEPLKEDKTIDWTVPQAFPKGYMIPLGVEVKTIDAKLIGKTTEKSEVPFCKWNYGAVTIAIGYQLAPIDPTDHPLHPDFNPSKYNDQ